MGDGWETARKPDRPAILEVSADGFVKVSARRLDTLLPRVVVDNFAWSGDRKTPQSVSTLYDMPGR